MHHNPRPPRKNGYLALVFPHRGDVVVLPPYRGRSTRITVLAVSGVNVHVRYDPPRGLDGEEGIIHVKNWTDWAQFFFTLRGKRRRGKV